MLFTRQTILATAIHEAGHAIVQLADAHAPTIEAVSVIRNGNRLGIVVTAPRLPRNYLEALRSDDDEATAVIRAAWVGLAWKDIIQFLAGPVAELRWRLRNRVAVIVHGRGMRDHCLAGAAPEGADLFEVHWRLLWSNPDDAGAAFDRAWAEAEYEVARHWKSIEALGRRLAREGRLTTAELEGVVLPPSNVQPATF